MVLLASAVTFLLGGLVAAALLHTFRNLAGVEIKALAAGDAFAGGDLIFSLSLAARAIDRLAISISASGGRPVGSSAESGRKWRSFMPSSACASAVTSMRVVREKSSTQVVSLEAMRRRATT